MSISSQAEAIKIPQQQADLLGALLRLPASSPIDAISRLVLKDNAFCDRLLDIAFTRRPPKITEAVLHEGIRDLGLERIRLLFLSNNISQAFSSAKLGDFDEGAFWVNSIRRGSMAYYIAQDVEYADPFEAFIAGFMAEIGCVLLAARFPHMSAHLKDLRSRPSQVRSHVERILLGSNHCEEVDGSGLTHLIPPRIIHSVIAHLDPYPGNDRKSILAMITAVSISLGDVVHTVPPQPSLASAETFNKSLPKPVNLSDVFDRGMTLAHTVSQDLGYQLPTPRNISEYLCGKPIEQVTEDDPLANLFRFTMEKALDNRFGFFEKLEQHLSDPTRQDDFSIMLVDLDSFSKINDTYGCPTADALLEYLGQEITRSARSIDHVAKIDADQFAILMPKTQAMGAKVVAERIRALVKGSTIAMGTIRPNCTASVGGLTIKSDRKVPPADKIWDKVLQLVKMAKDKGKNRIIWAS